jgi:alanine racemase
MAYITLKRQHFFHNLDIIAKLSKGKDKIALVLKDNAYGHGLREIASMAAEYGITKAVVRNDSEAKQVENFFEYILVLADKPKEASSKIRYTINDIDSIMHFPPGTKVELKVNSGMNRNGIEAEQLKDAFAAITKQQLTLEGVFTHHACADESDELFYRMQQENFEQIQQEAKELASQYKIEPLRFHSCNSAALFRSNDFHEDMARVGIAAYGCLEMPEGFASDAKQLKPLLSLYAKRISKRYLQAQQSVGYGATYRLQEAQMISNYDFGYADGFLRSTAASYMTPNKELLAGRISMDNSSFVSDAEEILIYNDARELAKSAGTISYEVLTALRADLERRVV